MKERQRQLREVAILDAAKGLLSQKGFAAMTLEDVISEVGISKPTFYQHFASKEDLAVSVLLRALREGRIQLNALQAALPADAALRAMIVWSIDRKFSPQGRSNFVGATSFFDHETLRDAERDFTETIAELIERGQHDGVIKTSSPPIVVAQAFLSILKDPVYEYEVDRGNLDVATLKSGITALLLD